MDGSTTYSYVLDITGVLATSGLSTSSNLGQTWTKRSSKTESKVTVAQLDGSMLLAGTDSVVVELGPAGWAPAGSGFPDVRVTDLYLSADGRAIFATTYGRGTYEAVLRPAATALSIAASSSRVARASSSGSAGRSSARRLEPV